MSFDYVHVLPGSEDVERYRECFIGLYVEVFSGAPFYECFTREEVAQTFQELMMQGGYLCCVLDRGKLIAFGTGMPLVQRDSVLQNICKGYFKPEQAFYNSDVATHSDYRQQGIGSALIEMRIAYALEQGYRYSVFRTNRNGSMSAPIYQKLGFQSMSKTTWVSQPRSKPDISEMDERMIMWKAL